MFSLRRSHSVHSFNTPCSQGDATVALLMIPAFWNQMATTNLEGKHFSAT